MFKLKEENMKKCLGCGHSFSPENADDKYCTYCKKFVITGKLNEKENSKTNFEKSIVSKNRK